MKTLNGIPASSGIVSGRAFVYGGCEEPDIPRYDIKKEQVPAERCRVLNAIAEAAGELRVLHQRALKELSDTEAPIFKTHLMMAEDPDFTSQILDQVTEDLINAEWALKKVSGVLIQKLAQAKDPLFNARAMDIADVVQRIQNKLLSISGFSLFNLVEDSILVARDLLPSEILTMERARILGLVIDMGSRTSHTAILARALGLPAVLGLSTATKEIKPGDFLAIDGEKGLVLINPDEAALAQFQEAGRRFRLAADSLLTQAALPAETTDGRRVSLLANIESAQESEQVRRFGAEGVGLFRSEFLLILYGQFADEQVQFNAYRQVVQSMSGLPVTIRTLDVGGDKLLPDYQQEYEKNPLLGWRAIRFCLSMPELFKTQLRAILRASAYGTVRILFPLISGVEELDQARLLLEEAKGECRQQGQPFDPELPVGVMIEVPSAALTAEILAKRADFFSIGTNDLVQYTLAVDRGNEQVGYLAQPTHPAILRLLKGTIDAAHAQGIPAALCGELAGDPAATALLLGLGLDELSMTASSIPQVKRIIRGAALESCRGLAEEALRCSSSHEAGKLTADWMKTFFPEGEESLENP